MTVVRTNHNAKRTTTLINIFLFLTYFQDFITKFNFQKKFHKKKKTNRRNSQSNTMKRVRKRKKTTAHMNNTNQKLSA